MNMKKKTLYVLLMTLAMPLAALADGYNNLWSQVNKANENDLPQTEMKVLQKIIAKAQAEKNYGQLVKAELTSAEVTTRVSPDSVLSAVAAIERRLEEVKDDPVASAIYNSVLGRLYQDNETLGKDRLKKSKEYYKASMRNPVVLAACKAPDYQPLVIVRYASNCFNHDLLSVIGYAAGDYKTLHSYYEKVGERQATMLTALEMLRQNKPKNQCEYKKSGYLQSVDSLIEKYGDLRVCGEAAVEHYNFIENCSDVTAKDKIDYIDYAINKWENCPRMNELRNKKRELTAQSFSVQINESVSMPGKPHKVQLYGLCNISTLNMAVYRADIDGEKAYQVSTDEDYDKIKKYIASKPDTVYTRMYAGHPDYEVFKDSMTMAAMPAGVYMLEFSTDPKSIVSRRLMYVSDVRCIYELLPGNEYRLVAVNATSGQPLPAATFRLQTGDDEDLSTVTLTADKNGEARYRKAKTIRQLFVYTDSDKYCPALSYMGGYFSYYNRQDEHKEVNVYTDRSIYRPGQTVHASAIMMSRQYITTKAVEGKPVELALMDANYKEVERKTATTDKYGTAAADFTLPTGKLNGTYHIEANADNQVRSSIYFRVEEYKRPTFEVTFDEVKQAYQAGDTLRVKGHAKTYSGVPVQNAKVSYEVTRRQALWWTWYRDMRATAVMEKDTIKTDADGNFTVKVPVTLPEEEKRSMFYHFSVTADVTDGTGETRSGELTLPLGNKAAVLMSDLPERIQRDSLKTMTLTLKNAAGQDVAADVKFSIDGGKENTAATGKAINMADYMKVTSGEHLLTAACQGDTLKRKFILFAVDDKTLNYTTDDWFYLSSNQFGNDGKPVYLQLGTAAPKAHIVYNVISGNKVLENGAIDLDGNLYNRQLNYCEDYGNGLLLTFAWMKQGKLYTHSEKILRPLPDKNLKLKWNTFRDKLKPGQKEEWSLHITTPDGKPADAQLMATMYDKSLEQIMKHSWNLNPGIRVQAPSTFWTSQQYGIISENWTENIKPLHVTRVSLSHFDDNLFDISNPVSHYMIRGRGVMLAKMANDMAPTMMMAESASAASLQEVKIYDKAERTEGSRDVSPTASAGKTAQMRENLNETAFFYPQLTADAKGDVAISFTLPESLTTWRFMGIAHTADISTGYIDAETVAQKDVMIQPDMPRFLRVGDNASVSARISNVSNKVQAGVATMELIDPETEQTVYRSTSKYNLAGGKSEAVSFAYTPTADHSILICRMTAQGAAGSDGEQHYLPILPDKERVTVTLPIIQTQPGKTNVDVRKLMPAQYVQDAQSRVTVEYTNNPAWLMVQSLPSMAVPGSNDAISLAQSYYANAIGRYLMNRNAAIKTTVQLWKQERGNETSLTSNLMRNEELKDIVNEETPWVGEANHETAQKQQLTDFFDENNMDSRQQTALKRLRALQLADGAWSWWPGMDGSLYMTMAVSESLVRLGVMTGDSGETSQMIDRAFGYMDKEIVKIVEDLKRDETKGGVVAFPHYTALQYLYISSLYNRKTQSAVNAAIDYLIPLLKKEVKAQSIYGKALSAIVLNKYGAAADARRYAQSLKEYSVLTHDAGRYYDTDRAGYSWCDYKIPTEVAAIEALKQITPTDVQTISEMQQWLLHEKQTQAWDTPINSVNAVYAFLAGNDTQLTSGNAKPAIIAVDGKPVKTGAATAGLGYVKLTVPSATSTMTVDKTSEGTSWGAVYAQYMQPTKEVSEASSGIAVKREIVNAKTVYAVGDRVKVRITIKADRDYDFVEVADKRAACLEPVHQLSGYHWRYYISPKDNSTNYYFDRLPKGTQTLETEYYIDRAGRYETGTVVAQCAYSPEFRATAPSQTIVVK